MGVKPGVEGMLAPIQSYLDDPMVAEILVNRPQEIYVEKQGKMAAFPVAKYTVRTLLMLFQLIANESQQLLDHLHPLLSASIFDGSRVQLVLPPVAKFPCMALRRQSIRHYQWSEYASTECFSKTIPANLDKIPLDAEEEALMQLYQQCKWHQFLELAVKNKKNIVISGGTSTGKTTLLNALLTCIPSSERLVVLEDTREVSVSQPNVVQLMASKGEQGMAQVSMQSLVQCCLRLRPDRIICGEIRGKEILDFISACSTGHDGSLTSIHANHPRVAFMRMVQMYKLNNVPFMTDEAIMRELDEVIDVIVQLKRVRGKRCVSSIYFKNAVQKP